jgi:DNA polymerase III beta subunit, central domain
MASYRNRITATPVALHEYQKETNMENIEIEIPMQVLDAATICTAVKDVRFYLNGVAINKGHVVSTDGHRAFACKIDGLDENIEVIIPTEAIKAFIKKVPSKNRKGHCTIVVDRNARQGKISNFPLQVHELFIPIDGKFPDWQRIYPKDAPFEYQGHYPTFNWSYMADFQKMHKALGGNGINVLLRPKSKNEAALVDFDGTLFDHHAKGVIMPLRG